MKSKTYRDVLPRLLDMAEFIRDAQEMSTNDSFESWVQNKNARYALERVLELLGEATRNVPDVVKSEFPGIPWRKLIALRTVLAHDYGEIKHEILYKTAREDLPKVAGEIEEMIAAIESRGDANLPGLR